MNLPLGKSMLTSFRMLLISIELEKTELEVKMFVFIISPVGTPIQDGGIEKRSSQLKMIWYVD